MQREIQISSKTLHGLILGAFKTDLRQPNFYSKFDKDWIRYLMHELQTEEFYNKVLTIKAIEYDNKEHNAGNDMEYFNTNEPEPNNNDRKANDL